MNYPFGLCRTTEGDRLLKRVLSSAISVLSRHLPRGAIKDLQISGSLAYGEGTVIATRSEVLSSDLDLLMLLKFPYYIISVATRLDEKLSEIATSNAHAMGIKTHVTFTSDSYMPRLIRKILRRSSIYDYEFAFNKSLLGEPIDTRVQPPSFEDAIQLIFTSIAEYVTLYQGLTSHLEKLYWLAKRTLTLIYSGLILERKPRLSYTARVRKALDVLPSEVLSSNEASITEACLAFKISGDAAAIPELFGSRSLRKTIIVMEGTWLRMVSKILRYELKRLYSSGGTGSRYRNLDDLVNLYFARSKKSVPKMISYVLMLLLVSAVTRRPYIVGLAGIAWRSKHTLTSLSNYLVASELMLEMGSGRAGASADSLTCHLRLPRKSSAITKLWSMVDSLRYIR